MPPRRGGNHMNQIYIDALETIQSGVDSENHYYMTLSKAIGSVRKYHIPIESPEDARHVQFIGEKIVNELKKHFGESEAGERASPPPPKKRGRPKKAAPEPAPQSAPVASSSRMPSTSSQPYAPSAPTTSNAYRATEQSSKFLFSFLDLYDVEIHECRGDIWDGLLEYKIVYPNDQPKHAHMDRLSGPEPAGLKTVAMMNSDLADGYYNCTSTWHSSDKRPVMAKPSAARRRLDALSEALATDKQGPRGGIATMDPTRSRNDTVPLLNPRETAFTGGHSAPVASGSSQRTRTASQASMEETHYASAAASGSSHAGPSRATAGTVNAHAGRSAPVPSGSSQQARAPGLARANTVNNMPPPPPPVARGLNRTESAPSSFPPPGAGRGPRMSFAVPNLAAQDDIEDPYAMNVDVDTHFTAIVIRRGEYDVKLVLDNREVGTRAKRDFMANELVKMGIPVMKASMSVGDVGWVACRKRPLYDGYDEITLDYIVERKTMEDLSQSIKGKDGRFHEQKFRLANAGMTRMFYVVEGRSQGYNKDDETWIKAVHTALSSTQVVDGLLVAETKNTQGTVAKYAAWHEAILDDLQDKTLYVIPDQKVKRYSYLAMQKTLRKAEPERKYLISFNAFQALNSKNGHRTVQDTWARMLLSIKGMSPEKVKYVVAQYPTPLLLRQAFKEAMAREQQDAEDARVHFQTTGKKRKEKVVLAACLLEHLGEETTRRVGPALSQLVFEVMMSNNYD